MTTSTRRALTAALCISVALLSAGCSKKKPSDTAPRPSITATAGAHP